MTVTENKALQSTQSNTKLWAYYVGGILIALVIKYACYVYQGKKKFNKPFSVSTKEWFLEQTVENAASWATSVINLVAAWTIGRIYINKIITYEFANYIPVDISFSMLLGLLSEYIAPNFVKWIISKFPKG